MPRPIVLTAALVLGTASGAQVPDGLAAGTYTLDPAHSTVIFSVDHLGLSGFTAGFDRISGRLTLDPAAPEDAALSATIDASSLDLPAPGQGFLDAMLAPPWFDVAAHPEITFVSDSLRMTGETTAEVTGTLTLNGIGAPVTLDVTFNGAYPPGVIEPHGRIGFSAAGALRRSDFGMDFGIPAPGSDLGVGDTVTIRIEAEFTGPS